MGAGGMKGIHILFELAVTWRSKDTDSAEIEDMQVTDRRDSSRASEIESANATGSESLSGEEEGEGNRRDR